MDRYRRLREFTYYFHFYPKEGQIAIQFSGERPRFYPMSYTYKECVEDFCDRKGYEFHQMLTQFGTHHGSGHFEYYRHI